MATRRREKKKKSNNGIWIGSAISGGVILILTFAFYMQSKGAPADNLSGAITEAALAKQTLDTNGLPNLGEAPGGSGSLNDLFIAIAKAKLILLSKGYDEEQQEKAPAVIQALHGAAASSFAADVFDAKIPPKYFESPELKEDIAALGQAIKVQITAHNEKAEFDQAQGIALSYLNFGKQAYEKNTRLKSRQRGLIIMKSALTWLSTVNRARYDDGEIEQDALTEANSKIMEWQKAISAVINVWNSKFKTIESVSSPNTADIIKVANEDKDVSFRAYATLRLGYVLYERGEKSSQKVIKEAIEALKSDSNPLVAKAAKEAESIDRDEYHELRK